MVRFSSKLESWELKSKGFTVRNLTIIPKDVYFANWDSQKIPL
jgi:hypothetical protein